MVRQKIAFGIVHLSTDFVAFGLSCGAIVLLGQSCRKFVVLGNGVLQVFVLPDDCDFVLVVALDEIPNAVGVDFRLERRGVKNRRLAVAQRNNFFVEVNFADNFEDVRGNRRNFVVNKFEINRARKSFEINAGFLLRVELSPLLSASHCNFLIVVVVGVPFARAVESLNSRADNSDRQQSENNQQSRQSSSEKFFHVVTSAENFRHVNKIPCNKKSPDVVSRQKIFTGEFVEKSC